MMRLVVSDQALTDMVELLEYIRNDRPSAAERMHDRLWRELDFLCEHPFIGHLREDVRDDRYRFKRVKSCLICYRLDGSDLRVVRILHGARDFRRVQFE
jgi:plasmid stabilization system protein ParE